MKRRKLLYKLGHDEFAVRCGPYHIEYVDKMNDLVIVERDGEDEADRHPLESDFVLSLLDYYEIERVEKRYKDVE